MVMLAILPIVFGMIRSKQGGATGTWESINNGLGGKLNVTSIVVNPSNSDQLHITLRSGGVYTSSDGGNSWSDITNNLPERNIYALVTSPSDFQTLYVGTRFYGIYKSSDGGASWSRILEPQKTVAVDEVNSLFGALAVNPQNTNMIAASDWWSGVYITLDGGNSWTLNNNQLSTRDIKDLEFSADGKFLYAASSGEGVFRMQTTTEALVRVKSE